MAEPETTELYIDEIFVWGDIGKRDGSGVLAAPVRIPYQFPSQIKSVATGVDFTLILLQNNTLLGFGNTFFGQLGIAPTLTPDVLKSKSAWVRAPVPIEGLPAGEYPRSVAVGEAHALVLSSSGKVYSAGSNMHFELGSRKGLSYFDTKTHTVSATGEHGPSVIPFRTRWDEVPLPILVSSIAVGKWNNYAVTVDGSVYSWGTAALGALGHAVSDPVEFCNGEERAFFNREGEQLCTVKKPRRVESLFEAQVRIEKVAAGNDHALYLSEAKDVYSSGCGRYGRLGAAEMSSILEPQEPINNLFPERKCREVVTDVFAGSETSFVLRRSDELGLAVYVFGLIANNSGVSYPTLLSELCGKGIIGISSKGANHSAWNAAGDLYIWGKNPYCTASGIANFYAAREAAVKPVLCQLFAGKRVVGASCGKKAVFAIVQEPVEKDSETNDQVVPKREIDMPFIQILHASKNSEAKNLALAQNIMALPANADAFRNDILGAEHGAAYNTAFANQVEHRYSHELHQAEASKKNDAYLLGIGKSLLGARALEQGKKVQVWMENVYALGVVLDKVSETPLKGKRVSTFRVRWLRQDWVDEDIELNSDDEITVDSSEERNPNRWMHGWVQKRDTVQQLW